MPEGLDCYGDLRRPCPACGEVYLNPIYREIAISGIRAGDDKKLNPANLMVVLLGFLLFFGFYHYVVVRGDALGYLFLLMGLLSTGYGLYQLLRDWRSYAARLAWLDAERQASAARLADPDYLAALRAAGVVLPEHYQQENESETDTA